ncbi:hypothetical protein CEUSTIGMA_g4302.t1 [Chlamydomonas eustigma]|uniref:Uncharacterized protein n=1 Tax=Chlamydomonas eustigma TaxID=1157962 RepID=A0A250X1C4_9CHLO|nr:hypothetical protein CEUSTIGMA_g4302.t1 [Chlamydomonas eustigma]|eukprot:GAX76856.1 hypothetical protein CEUSTIGMA_g4302.t1 [Chlamydomonas eustigma]
MTTESVSSHLSIFRKISPREDDPSVLSAMRVEHESSLEFKHKSLLNLKGGASASTLDSSFPSSSTSSASASPKRPSTHSLHGVDPQTLGSVIETAPALYTRQHSLHATSDYGPSRHEILRRPAPLSLDSVALRLRSQRHRQRTALSQCSGPLDEGLQPQSVPAPPSMPRPPSALGSPKNAHLNRTMSLAVAADGAVKNAHSEHVMKDTSDLHFPVWRYASQIVEEARSELQTMHHRSSSPSAQLKDVGIGCEEEQCRAKQMHGLNHAGPKLERVSKTGNSTRFAHPAVKGLVEETSHSSQSLSAPLLLLEPTAAPEVMHQIQRMRSSRSVTSDGSGRDCPEQDNAVVTPDGGKQQGQLQQLGPSPSMTRGSSEMNSPGSRCISMPQPTPSFRKASRSILDDLEERTCSSPLYFIGSSSPVDSSFPEHSMAPRSRTPSMHGGLDTSVGVSQSPFRTEMSQASRGDLKKQQEDPLSAPLLLLNSPSQELIRQVSSRKISRSVTSDGTGRGVEEALMEQASIDLSPAASIRQEHQFDPKLVAASEGDVSRDRSSRQQVHLKAASKRFVHSRSILDDLN